MTGPVGRPDAEPLSLEEQLEFAEVEIAELRRLLHDSRGRERAQADLLVEVARRLQQVEVATRPRL